MKKKLYWVREKDGKETRVLAISCEDASYIVAKRNGASDKEMETYDFWHENHMEVFLA